MSEKILRIKRFEYIPYDDFYIKKVVDKTIYKSFDGKVFYSENDIMKYIESSLKDRKRFLDLDKTGALSKSEINKLFPNSTHLLKEPKVIKQYSSEEVYSYILYNEQGQIITKSNQLHTVEEWLNDYCDVKWNLEMIVEEENVDS